MIRKKSEFTLYDAQDYLAEQAKINLLSLPEMPSNSGYMRFVAGQNLGLNGRLKLVGGALDLSVTGDEASLNLQARNTDAAFNTLSTEKLNQLMLSSLLVGGIRSVSADDKGIKTYNIDQFTPIVILGDNSTLVASDIIMVASNSLSIGAGAKVSSMSKPQMDVANISIKESASLLRVSGGSDIQVFHSNPDSTKGNLTIDATAKIESVGSVYLDASRSLIFNSIPVVSE
jgi:hypothetical protein